jgi:integrase
MQDRKPVFAREMCPMPRMLLDKGMPVHQVAARIGDNPAILLRVYAQLTKKNTRMSEVVNALGTLILGSV